ncbi:MAG: DNA starvation/stationary phase protection protein, partial [Rhodothermia bacterium]|nr:DNA starvation/stationary phase protection protein [Rhodothermia bacterium]
LAVLFHQYQKHHWLVDGPQFRDLHLYLEESYSEVQENLDELAERITILGGIPSSSPKAQADVSYVQHEEEGGLRVRTMLKHDLSAEQAIIARLRDSIERASAGKDFGTERLLKSVLYAAENRAHHLDHYLEANSLAPSSESTNGVLHG